MAPTPFCSARTRGKWPLNNYFHHYHHHPCHPCHVLGRIDSDRVGMVVTVFPTRHATSPPLTWHSSVHHFTNETRVLTKSSILLSPGLSVREVHWQVASTSTSALLGVVVVVVMVISFSTLCSSALSPVRGGVSVSFSLLVEAGWQDHHDVVARCWVVVEYKDTNTYRWWFTSLGWSSGNTRPRGIVRYNIQRAAEPQLWYPNRHQHRPQTLQTIAIKGLISMSVVGVGVGAHPER